MARRASSRIRPLWIVCTLAAFVLAVVGTLLIQNTGGEPFRTVPELDVTEYLANANSLRGNHYKVKGVISQSLVYSPEKGRLFSVEIGTGGENVLPVLVPPDLSYLNLQKGQHYTFLLEVGDAGLLFARKMQKG